MTDRGVKTAFVFISDGGAQASRQERLGQVRSHITSTFYRRQREKKQRYNENKVQRSRVPLLAKEQATQGGESTPSLGSVVQPTALLISNPLLDSASMDLQTRRRVQEFFNVHLERTTQSNKTFSNAMHWAVVNPFYMSTKILYASSWDDICYAGELNAWTLRQRYITGHLLADALKVKTRLDIRVIFATLQMLLVFDLLAGNVNNICQLRKLCGCLIRNALDPGDEVFGRLLNVYTLFNQVETLQNVTNTKSGTDTRQGKPPLHFDSSSVFLSPLDFSLFTYRPLVSTNCQFISFPEIGYLYLLVSMAASYPQTGITRLAWDNLIENQTRVLGILRLSPHSYQEMNPLANDSTHVSSGDETMLTSILIITSCLLFGNEDNEKLRLATLAARLRGALDALRTQSGCSPRPWEIFPGLWAWCCAVGIRFSEPGPQQNWFLVNFLRIQHSWMSEAYKRVAWNAESIISCLTRISKLRTVD